MGGDKKKRKDRSRSRQGSSKKKRSRSRAKSSSLSKRRKEGSKKTRKRSSSSSHRRSGSRKGSPRRSSSRKGAKGRDRGKSRRARSKSRRKSESRSRSGSKDSPSQAKSRRRPRTSGFDQREPVPESQLSEVQMVAPVMGPPPKEPNPEVEAFLATNPVEPHAANQLRGLPVHLQRVVLARGSLMSARDRSAVLTSRISDALTGSSGLGMLPPAPMHPGHVHPGHVHPGIEALIARYDLDARCAALLRMLPPDRQDRAAELPVREARNPSAFVMAQIQLLFGWRSGFAPTPAPPPPMRLTDSGS